MTEKIQTLKFRAKQKQKENKLFFKKLKKKKPGIVDEAIHPIHDEVFAETNCLDCANCCQTTSPLLTKKDIDRISKEIRKTPSQFISEHLEIDEDEDFVFQSTPCPFLLNSNYCSIYEIRPKACREYPHTNRRKFVQALDVTLKNLEICPAVFEIIERLKKQSRQ